MIELTRWECCAVGERFQVDGQWTTIMFSARHRSVHLLRHEPGDVRARRLDQLVRWAAGVEALAYGLGGAGLLMYCLAGLDLE